MASLSRRQPGMAHLAKILVTCREARAAEMRASEVSASDRVARKSAAMSPKVMSAAVTSAKAMSTAMTVTAAVTSAMATASGDCLARQHHQESKSRNSQRAPSHGTLPAVTPLTMQRE
jgi:hypothetical protein